LSSLIRSSTQTEPQNNLEPLRGAGYHKLEQSDIYPMPRGQSLTKSVKERLTAQDETLARIEDRVTHAPILNGGFDKLNERLNKIESAAVTHAEAAARIGTEVKEIHEVIFDPKVGLVALTDQHAKWMHGVKSACRWLIGALSLGALTGLGKLVVWFFSTHYHP
jgi:hypothetical protein